MIHTPSLHPFSIHQVTPLAGKAVPDLDYGGWLKILGSATDPASLSGTHHLAQGLVHVDPSHAQLHPGRFHCPGGGYGCAHCTTSPHCIHGTDPQLPPPPPDPYPHPTLPHAGHPIAIHKDLHVRSHHGQDYLVSTKAHPGSIPVFPADSRDLAAVLTRYREATHDKQDTVFHVYRILDCSGLPHLAGKLLAVPVAPPVAT